MKIKDKLFEALVEQVAYEYAVSLVYMSYYTVFEDMGMKNLALWAKSQAIEERGHGDMIMDYLAERGHIVLPVSPDLDLFDEVDGINSDLVESINAIAKAEEDNFERITDLVALAREMKDFATDAFLAPLMTEQVEEVDTTSSFLELVDSGNIDRATIDMWVHQNLLDVSPKAAG